MTWQALGRLKSKFLSLANDRSSGGLSLTTLPALPQPQWTVHSWWQPLAGPSQVRAPASPQEPLLCSRSPLGIALSILSCAALYQNTTSSPISSWATVPQGSSACPRGALHTPVPLRGSSPQLTACGTVKGSRRWRGSSKQPLQQSNCPTAVIHWVL